ncbi:sulfite exporter TauE/SafE family protein [Microbaculum marinum]|uniref:Probable membrane transporter protein n=1 Tax=Microbaculum marinum TaxID=1764581 RepID=A0AAW9RMS9_9HYPH
MSDTAVLEPRILAALAAIYLLGGFVKGAAAFGQPLFTIPLSSLMLPVPTAIAISVVPVFVSNILQLFQNFAVWREALPYWPFYLTLLIGMVIGLQALTSVDQEALLMVIGALILAFVVTRLIDRRGHLPPPPGRVVMSATGFLSGLAAGTASFVAFPSLLMFTSYDLDRRVFAFLTCVMFIIVTVTLSGGLAAFGLYGRAELLTGALCIAPSAVGQVIGQRIRDRISDRLLRRIMLALLAGIAISLVLRGL